MHISNRQVVTSSKLVDSIQLGHDNNQEYNSIKVLIDLDNSDISDTSNCKEPLTMLSGIEVTPTIVVCQIKIKDPDILDKLCVLYIKSKWTRVVRQNKSMIATSNKLEEVHANLWGPYDPPS